jgi:glycosyltransferase involved in cell wall biosynthesis
VKTVQSPRIAWLLPVAWFYWQPTLSEFTKLFPQTKIFTALWPGWARGFEDTLEVEIVGERKVIEVKPGTEGYGSSFTYVSPAVVNPLLRFRPQIIFTNAFGIWTTLALLLKPLWRWKVVIAYEGSSPGVDFRNSRLRLLVRQMMASVADAFITNSHAGREYLTQVLHFEESRAFVFPYEIPSAKSLLEGFEETDLPHPELQQPVFLFVGRVIPRKGLDVLLQACLLLEQKGFKNYTLLVVGDGEQREKLQTFTREHDLTSCVKWVGHVNYDQINSYFQAADVFVLPTLEDTWGVVVLEAMLFGKPVLCSSGAGTSEMITDGENGYVFDPKQPQELAVLMQKFIDSPQIIEEMGKRSYQKILQYNPETASQFLAKVVSFLVQKS